MEPKQRSNLSFNGKTFKTIEALQKYASKQLIIPTKGSYLEFLKEQHSQNKQKPAPKTFVEMQKIISTGWKKIKAEKQKKAEAVACSKCPKSSPKGMKPVRSAPSRR
jgi:hypothetical protein